MLTFMKKKQDLKSLTRKELLTWFKNNNIKKYRAEQTFNWMYKNNILKFDEMNNIPSKLINKLEEISYITNLKIKDRLNAKDGTVKYLWELFDNNTIESVYIPYYGE